LKEEKITQPGEQANIQRSRSDISSSTEILPSKNPNETADTEYQFGLEVVVVPPEMANFLYGYLTNISH